MNRARKTTETFEQYRHNLKVEEVNTKQHLAGHFMHVSTTCHLPPTNPPVKGEGSTYTRK